MFNNILIFETHVCVPRVAWLTQFFRPWLSSFQTALSLQFCRSKECKQINMLLKARSSHVSCETSPFKALANLKKLGGHNWRFKACHCISLVFKKQRVLGVEYPLDWSLYLKPETVSRSYRYIIVSTFWQMMRACFDFLGQKTGEEARPPSALPKVAVLSSHHVSFLEQSSKSQSFTPSRL